MTQSQDEFYFSLPYAKMDLCLYGKNNGVPLIDVSEAIGFTAEQTKRIYMDIEQKRRTTKYLHAKPQLLGEVKEIGT
jgi:NAD+ synthase